MIEKLTSIKRRFEEIELLIVQPDAMSDMKVYAKLNQEYRSLEKIVVKADAYLLALENLENIEGVSEIIAKEEEEIEDHVTLDNIDQAAGISEIMAKEEAELEEHVTLDNAEVISEIATKEEEVEEDVEHVLE